MAKTKEIEEPGTWFAIKHIPPASAKLLVRTVHSDGTNTTVEGKTKGLHMVIEDLKFQMAQLQIEARKTH